jgi:hypothetical protein
MGEKKSWNKLQTLYYGGFPQASPACPSDSIRMKAKDVIKMRNSGFKNASLSFDSRINLKNNMVVLRAGVIILIDVISEANVHQYEVV